MKKYFPLLLVATLIVIFSSCKKDDPEPTTGRQQKTCTCDSVTSDDSSVTWARQYFDSQGRLILFEDYYDTDREWMEIEYHATYVIMKNHYNEYLDSNVYDLDAYGRVTQSRRNVFYYTLDEYIGTDTVYYDYVATGINVTTDSYSFSYAPDVTHYAQLLTENTIVNGNTTKYRSYHNGSFVSEETVVYDLNSAGKHYPTPWGFPEREPDNILFKSPVNIVTEYHSGTDISQFLFEYNEDGYITRFDGLENGTPVDPDEVSRFWYTCK